MDPLSWLFGKKEEKLPNQQAVDAEEYCRISELAKKAGSVNGRHHTTYTEEIRRLKQAQKYPEAVALLLKLIDAVEAQAKIDGFGLAARYYDHLIIVYRKMKDYEKAEATRQRYLNNAAKLLPRQDL